ncbi:MAG: co-chaperone GroES family protein [Hydrogenophaga sp.]|uniref:co-chaperone GroES family protein n=1 Tax=Hydrogenophaga sp. TaxID=1904254 RepID=UPI00261429BA|nr:co-chaperone GroES family protein [Hydrogenophaga sp.]MCV0439720.1 co-chaperone GroES family protein [Hydrogenophaga sp.]
MKYTPRLDFVVVRKDEPKEQSQGGILLPDSAKDERVPGTVLEIGPGRLSEQGTMILVDDLEVGDRVIFNKFTAYELDEKERLYLLRGNEITCKVND